MKTLEDATFIHGVMSELRSSPSIVDTRHWRGFFVGTAVASWRRVADRRNTWLRPAMPPAQAPGQEVRRGHPQAPAQATLHVGVRRAVREHQNPLCPSDVVHTVQTRAVTAMLCVSTMCALDVAAM
jgi:hypothetical protein